MYSLPQVETEADLLINIHWVFAFKDLGSAIFTESDPQVCETSFHRRVKFKTFSKSYRQSSILH